MKKNVNSIVEDTLLTLGASPGNLGFRYIVQAVPEFHKRQPMMNVYAEIALMHGSSVSRVERAIRHTFSNISEDKMLAYFGETRRTTENLLAILNMKIRREVDENED